MRFSHSFRVSADDIDEQRHVNNVAYLRWIQDVAVAHWHARATAEMRNAYYWVVVRHEIDYKKQGFQDELVTAATWVGKWTTVTCERFTEITCYDQLLVRSRTLWCMMDRQKARPARVPREIIELFGADSL